jgi:hypothetical protein
MDYRPRLTDGTQSHCMLLCCVCLRLSRQDPCTHWRGPQIVTGVSVLVATALCGLVQAVVGGQPLLIVGVAEPIVLTYKVRGLRGTVVVSSDTAAIDRRCPGSFRGETLHGCQQGSTPKRRRQPPRVSDPRARMTVFEHSVSSSVHGRLCSDLLGLVPRTCKPVCKKKKKCMLLLIDS